MDIAGRKIGSSHPPLVIAEIGINHGGDLAVAKEMVRLAAMSGCEMIKHQTHIIEDEMTEEAKQIFPPNADVSIWDVMARCALGHDEEKALKDYTESLGMIWISTPFSRAAADFLETLDVPAYKIGSGEVDNLPLIRHIARKGKPVIMSTGMQTIDSVRASVKILDDAGVEYALLECTNLYPSPPEIVSLQGVTDLKNAFPSAVVGFSDHSRRHCGESVTTLFDHLFSDMVLHDTTWIHHSLGNHDNDTQIHLALHLHRLFVAGVGAVYGIME